MSESLKEWRCINERIVRTRLSIEGVWVSVIQVYAPTEDSKNEVKDDFNEQLESTVREVPKQDNWQYWGTSVHVYVGRNVAVCVGGGGGGLLGFKGGEGGSGGGGGGRGVIGMHGEVVENRNGARLLQFCAEKGLVITNSWFQHKEIS